MEDYTVGKMMFVGLVALVIWGVTALLQARSESARRLRLVVVGALALAVAAGLFVATGPIGFVAVLAVCAAGIWIYAGNKK